MNKGRVLIADGVHEVLPESLRNMGYEVTYLPDIDDEGVDALLPDLSGIIINSKTIMDTRRLAMAGRLRFIGRLGSGLEIIDVQEAERLGIRVFNSPEGNCQAVAEHALGMLLALYNQLLMADGDVRNFSWDREARRGYEIEGKTIGIIGVGYTGSAFARVLSGFDVKVCLYDKYKHVEVPSSCRANYMVMDSMAACVASADVVSLHLPLTSETRQMVNAEWLRSCKSKSVLINTSRGPIVNTADLVACLDEGHLSGACLDVFENEKQNEMAEEAKYVYKLLYKMSNVILSPHVAGWTHESKFKLSRILVDKIDTL